MTERLLRNYPYVLAASACLGLACANAARGRSGVIVGLAALGALACALAAEPLARVALLAVALLLGGWWWGSARLDAIDSSVLLPRVGRRGRRWRSSPARRAAEGSICAFRRG